MIAVESWQYIKKIDFNQSFTLSLFFIFLSFNF